VDEVKLPNFANGSAEEFIRVMRLALESDEVAQSLNGWIDLVFGCKQDGQAAADALNVFGGFSYEGVYDVDGMDRSQLEVYNAQIQVRTT
jgi:hypothetical protein